MTSPVSIVIVELIGQTQDTLTVSVFRLNFRKEPVKVGAIEPIRKSLQTIMRFGRMHEE